MRRFASLAVLCMVACKHDAAPPPARSAPAPAPLMSDTKGAPGTQDLGGFAQLQPLLSDEQAHRPAVKVPVEKIFDSLTQRGVAIATKHQVLGRTAGAAYCMLGVTDANIAIAACEYPSHQAAETGAKLLDTRYAKLVPDAKRRINGETLVTVANGDRAPAVRDRVFETFMAL